VIRRLRVEWPDAAPFRSRGGRPIRWLAVSDDEEPALSFELNRQELGPLDAIVGAGDLQPDYLGFLADAFRAPLAYVRGNHDVGPNWVETVRRTAAEPLASGSIEDLQGLPLVALEWPGIRHHDRQRHDRTATFDVLRLAVALSLRRLRRDGGPTVVLSHAPPLGVGDGREDPYHVGFSAYRWLLDRFRPPLWLHGHVHPASVESWRLDHEGSEVVNVTGAVLVEIVPPGGDGADGIEGADHRTDAGRLEAAERAVRGLGGELDRGDREIHESIAPGDADTDRAADGVGSEAALEVTDTLDGLAVEVQDEVARTDPARAGG
jgi:hypothetical protein